MYKVKTIVVLETISIWKNGFFAFTEFHWKIVYRACTIFPIFYQSNFEW